MVGSQGRASVAIDDVDISSNQCSFYPTLAKQKDVVDDGNYIVINKICLLISPLSPSHFLFPFSIVPFFGPWISKKAYTYFKKVYQLIGNIGRRWNNVHLLILVKNTHVLRLGTGHWWQEMVAGPMHLNVNCENFCVSFRSLSLICWGTGERWPFPFPPANNRRPPSKKWTTP